MEGDQSVATVTPDATASGDVSPQQDGTTKADELEEIKVGSDVFKLPKQAAQAVKNLERGFHAKSQEAAQAKAQNSKIEDQFAQAFKANPRAMMQKFGIDPYEFSEMTLAEKIELMQMSPEQKELRELKAWKEEQEKAQKEQAEKAEAEKQSKAEMELGGKMKNEMLEAWKSSGLPADPFFGQKMAALVLAHSKAGQDLSFTDAAAKIKQDYITSVRNIVSQIKDPKGILEILGDEGLKALRQYELDRVNEKSSPKFSSQSKGPGAKPASSSSKAKPMNEKEYREYFSKLSDGS